MDRYALPSRLFVTGTGTDVGKTVVSAVLMCGRRGRYWKPVQSGLEGMTDTEWVRLVSGLPASHFVPERHRLTRPLSPHAAAALDGVAIELGDFKLPQLASDESLVVEGAGGIMVPLNDRHFMLDLIVHLGLPVLLVASSGLGTINHTLLTVDKLRQREVPVAGVVMIGPLNPDNRQAIEHFGQIRVVAEIEPLPVLDCVTLQGIYNEQFARKPESDSP